MMLPLQITGRKLTDNAMTKKKKEKEETINQLGTINHNVEMKKI